jgi:hypothetical protein
MPRYMRGAHSIEVTIVDGARAATHLPKSSNTFKTSYNFTFVLRQDLH